MKLHWKILIALVVGALITGQIVTFRAIAGMNQTLEDAHTALAAARASMEKATSEYQAMLSSWNKMNNMPGMSAMDKGMMKMSVQSAATQKAMMDATNQALKAIEGVWKYEAGPK